MKRSTSYIYLQIACALATDKPIIVYTQYVCFLIERPLFQPEACARVKGAKKRKFRDSTIARKRSKLNKCFHKTSALNNKRRNVTVFNYLWINHFVYFACICHIASQWTYISEQSEAPSTLVTDRDLMMKRRFGLLEFQVVEIFTFFNWW